MDKPEALRLADALDECKYVDVYRCKQAAAELRRLHAQRDALLEALELAADFLEHATEFRIGRPGFEQAQAKARAAIKAVEGEKT